MLWRCVAVLGLLAAITLRATVSLQDDPWLARTPYGAPLRWPCCRTILVDVAGVPGPSREAALHAVSRAAALTGLRLRPTTALRGELARDIEVVWTDDALAPGVLASTQDFAGKGAECLVAARIRVSRLAVEGMAASAVELLVLHELGHAVGLRDFGEGLMNPSFTAGAAPGPYEERLLALAGRRPGAQRACPPFRGG